MSHAVTSLTSLWMSRAFFLRMSATARAGPRAHATNGAAPRRRRLADVPALESPYIGVVVSRRSTCAPTRLRYLLRKGCVRAVGGREAAEGSDGAGARPSGRAAEPWSEPRSGCDARRKRRAVWASGQPGSGVAEQVPTAGKAQHPPSVAGLWALWALFKNIVGGAVGRGAGGVRLGGVGVGVGAPPSRDLGAHGPQPTAPTGHPRGGACTSLLSGPRKPPYI